MDPGSKKDNILEIVCWKYSQNYFLKFPPTEEENLSTNQPSPGVVTTTTTPKPNQGPGGSPMLIQKQNSSQASPSPHFSPVPQIQVIDPNIELMKKQEAEKLRIQKEQLENQQKQLAEQQANAQRQQAEMVKKQQEEMKKQQDAIKQQQEAFEKQRQDQMAAQAKMLEQQKLQTQQQQQQQQLEQQKQMAAQQEALKLQQEKLKMEQNQKNPKAPITQQPISNVQIKTSLIENQIQMNQIQMATTSAPSGGIQIATTSSPSVGLNKADALNLNSQMELLKKQQEELKRQQLEFEKQKAGLIANANPAISTSTTTQVTTTSTSTITHPSYIRPLIGQQPLTSVLQTSDMEIDPLMYNWRTRERQWEMEELDREKQLELERERSTNFCKLQREKARKENEKTLKDIEAGLYGLEDGFKVKVNNNQNQNHSNPSPNKKNNAVAPSNKDSGQHNPPKSNQQSLSSHHQPSGPKSDKVLELASKSLFLFSFFTYCLLNVKNHI